MAFVSALIDKLEGTSSHSYNLNMEIDIIAAHLFSFFSENKQPVSVLLTGTCKDYVLHDVSQLLQPRVEGICRIDAHDSVLHNGETIKRLDAYSYAVIVEQEKHSLLRDIEAQMALLTRKDISVLGFIYIRDE